MQNGKIPPTAHQRIDALEASCRQSHDELLKAFTAMSKALVDTDREVIRCLKRSQTLMTMLWLLSGLNIMLLVIIMILGTRP